MDQKELLDKRHISLLSGTHLDIQLGSVQALTCV